MAVAQARMAWIRDQVNPDAPDETHIVVGIDCSERAEVGERVVSQLLNSALEGDEGVFYLLPHDLCYEATRSGGLVTVELLTQSRDAADAAPKDDDEDAPTEWVTVLSATIPFPEDAALPEPPILVIDHEGVVSLDELVAASPETGCTSLAQCRTRRSGTRREQPPAPPRADGRVSQTSGERRLAHNALFRHRLPFSLTSY